MNVTKCDCCGKITLDCSQIRRRDLVIQGIDAYLKQPGLIFVRTASDQSRNIARSKVRRRTNKIQ